MGPASKTSLNTSSHRIGEVDAAVRFDPKMMVKEDITGENREEKKPKKPKKTALLALGNL